MKLDTIDRRIISELSTDGRQEFTQLAKKLKLGRDRVQYRIRKLERSGVIRKYLTIINPTKLGYTLYKTYLRLDNNQRQIPKLMTYLQKHQSIFWIAECAGHWDLIFLSFARSPKEFSLLHDQFLARFNKIILSLSVFTLIDGWYFSRGYLSGMKDELVFVGGSGDAVEVSDLDLALLDKLAGNARMPYAQLAEECNCTPATARTHVERLEQTGVIAFYRVGVDLHALGREYFKASLYFAEFDPRKEDELKAYCQADPDVLLMIKQIGDCRIDLELEVESFTAYNEFIDRLRDRFAGYIKNIETLLVRKQTVGGVPRLLE